MSVRVFTEKSTFNPFIGFFFINDFSHDDRLQCQGGDNKTPNLSYQPPVPWFLILKFFQKPRFHHEVDQVDQHM